GLAIWLLPRLLKTSLEGGGFAVLGAMVWNAGLIAGLGAIAVGFSSGREWLEIPWQVALLLVARRGAGRAAAGVHAAKPARRPPLRFRVVHGCRAVLVPRPLSCREHSRPAFRRPGSDDELVVRAQRARLLLHAARARVGLLFHAEGDR